VPIVAVAPKAIAIGIRKGFRALGRGGPLKAEEQTKYPKQEPTMPGGSPTAGTESAILPIPGHC
ncbi:MAG TPA: hypothetical protein VEF05_08745, partial [Terriglobales bacterium]|nr:hypothetical protein [Terriglobales bacterium]